MKIKPVLVVLFAFVPLVATASNEIEVLKGPDNADLDLPFSEAVAWDDLLFVSGQIGAKPGTMELVPGGIKAQTRQAMLNIKAILERHDSGVDRILKCTIFMADMDKWSQNERGLRQSPRRSPTRAQRPGRQWSRPRRCRRNRMHRGKIAADRIGQGHYRRQ